MTYVRNVEVASKNLKNQVSLGTGHKGSSQQSITGEGKIRLLKLCCIDKMQDNASSACVHLDTFLRF